MQAVRLLLARLRREYPVASMVVDKTLEVGPFFIRTCRDCHFLFEAEETTTVSDTGQSAQWARSCGPVLGPAEISRQGGENSQGRVIACRRQYLQYSRKSLGDYIGTVLARRLQLSCMR
jgi:hypothetical protein